MKSQWVVLIHGLWLRRMSTTSVDKPWKMALLYAKDSSEGGNRRQSRLVAAFGMSFPMKSPSALKGMLQNW